eukprot:g11012.t1
MNNYFVQSAEIKDKYDGKFKNLEPWKRKFEARLNQRNGLGMPILKGHVPVEQKASPIGTIYVQTKAIFTQLLLALEIILTLNPKTVNGFKTDEDYELLIDIMTHDGLTNTQKDIAIRNLSDDLPIPDFMKTLMHSTYASDESEEEAEDENKTAEDTKPTVIEPLKRTRRTAKHKKRKIEKGKILLLIGWSQGMQIRVMDFKGAYLHAERPKEVPIYLRNVGTIPIPPGKIPFVRKSLYGTIDAGNLWKAEVHNLLTKIGFEQSLNDPCLYIRNRNGKLTYIATWVDDLIIATNEPDPQTIYNECKREGYDISLFEKINKYLGVRWRIDKEKFEFDQREYIETLLTQHGMQDSKPVTTPMNEKPSKADTISEQLNELARQKANHEIGDKEAEQIAKEINETKEYLMQLKKQKRGFRNIIGGLSHLARRARPEIQFSTFYLSRYQNDPGMKHYMAAKRILRYLQGTKNLTNKADLSKPLLEIYVDSDFAGDPDKNRSTTGYTILMYGIPIATKSRIQTEPTKSSTNAEIQALVDTTETALWIKHLLLEMNIDVKLRIKSDSQPTIDTIRNQKLLKGNKHCARRYHFVKGYVEREDIELEYVPTDQNIADLYTKPLARNKFEYFRNQFLFDPDETKTKANE